VPQRIPSFQLERSFSSTETTVSEDTGLAQSTVDTDAHWEARIQKRRNVKSAGVTEIDLEQARDGFDIMNLNGNYHCGDTRNTKTLVKSG